MSLQENILRTPDNSANWRESWHPKNVEVWGRIAEDKDDSLAIKWLHKAYQKLDNLSIYKTSVTGIVTKLLLTLKLRLLVLRLLVRPRLLLKVHLIVVRLNGEPAKMLVMFLLRDHAQHEGEAGVEVELSQ